MPITESRGKGGQSNEQAEEKIERTGTGFVIDDGNDGVGSDASVCGRPAASTGGVELWVRSGYSISERKVDTVPVNLHIGYTLFKGKKWRIPAGALEVAAEPFASPVTRVTQPGRRSGSIEAGLMLPVLTYHFDLGSRISPYLEGGLGALYHDLQGFDLGGGFSFTEMVGVGATYFLDDNLALNVGYRFRHTSNASIYEDNRGLNSHAFMAGFSYFLPQH